MNSPFNQLKPNLIVRGAVFPEPVQIIASFPMGNGVKIIGRGLRTERTYDPILSLEQVAALDVSPEQPPFDGDATRFRLGVEALRLGLAYEHDPYFALSIARVDPLPHQLEAVYDYFLKQPRIRFLLADDPGAGKTIMAGLLIKELKIRGLVKRVLIVTPANLTFQWQREMKDKFREQFEVIRSDVLRANYGSNPWQERDQVITSVSWVSTIDDAKDSLLRSHWDLVIVDEAHKMSAASEDHKTLAYQLGESLSEMTDHFLLMTATPHKGNKEQFTLFLRLLDRDVYADVASLEEAMRRQEAPFYLRRVKEALVNFPDPVTGEVKLLFTKRIVKTTDFQISPDEYDFYDALTQFVEDQSVRAAQDNSARGRALGFTMAMLQRRFASSMYAVRRSLERMKQRRDEILADPEAYRQRQIERSLPENYDELSDDEQQQVLAELEGVVASVDPDALREDINDLTRLINMAQALETREVETKLVKLRDALTQQGIFSDPSMKLLIFTEHKDTLTYLVEKLRGWGLSVTQIYGGMTIGDANTAGTRLCAEKEFKDSCQIMVATEAAGEGINLQFCWFMINYDIPWNPIRLEQRMGRIHRYKQEKDCLIFNFVATNTREGRVMQKLFERITAIERDLDPHRTGAVFNVLGDVLPANELERMLRDMYARNRTEQSITERIVRDVDTERFRRITHSTLEGLAKRELNLSAIVGRSAEARERRLVPEVVENFFVDAAPIAGIYPKETTKVKQVYRIGKVPRTLWAIGERLEPHFGKLAHEYKHAVFDKAFLTDEPTLEWVTPGHPLFEVVREDVLDRVQTDLQRGAVFWDLQCAEPARLDVFSAAIRDGRGNVLHRRLFVMEAALDGTLSVRQPMLLLDLVAALPGTSIPNIELPLPDRARTEDELARQGLHSYLEETKAARVHEIETIDRHVEISLNELITRQSLRLADLQEQLERGDVSPLLAANIKTTEDRLDDLNARLERRRLELRQERECAISDVRHIGQAWVLPHPERDSPGIAPMVRDEEIERIAVKAVIAFEEARGWAVESVESENRGFDLISRHPSKNDPATAIGVRFIEVKGRAGVGDVALSPNEYRTAERMKLDYWLYVVYNCATQPEVHVIQDPTLLQWKSVVQVEHYRLSAKEIKSQIPNMG
jgi:superfamily II DNA or RNA helicase